MKNIFFLVMFLSGIAYGQDVKTDSLLNGLKLLYAKPLTGYLFPDVSKNYFFPPTDTSRIDNPDVLLTSGLMADKQAKFSHNTSVGSVYILSEDKMPCLVPNLAKVENMPGRKFHTLQNADRMPNAFPKQKIPAAPYSK